MIAANATFALKAGLWLRRVRFDIFPSCCAASSPQSGRESIYRAVQFWPATSQYVLRGVVDVLARNPNAPNDPAQMEIWDYKGTRLPDLSSADMRDYIWQMCVYAELYRVRAGIYPSRAILYFLNELDLDPEPTSRPLRAVHEVQFTTAAVQQALGAFDVTAQAIIGCRANSAWPLPASAPGKETCDICDIRWNFPSPATRYQVRMPIA